MQAPNTQALDDQLKDMIVGLQRAVAAAIPHIKDDPRIVDKAIGDCKAWGSTFLISKKAAIAALKPSRQ